jgi:hypothetical protein
MSPVRIRLAAVLAIVVTLPAAPALAQKLAVKPGLWEVSMAEPKVVTQVCYTSEVLNGGASQFAMPPGMTCTFDVVQSTPRLIVTKSACTSPMAMQGETRMEVVSPESMTMQSTATMTMGGRTQTVKSSASYKWLKADCGSVKPFDPKNPVP